MTGGILKPARLHPGDRVAVLSPSWGGPSTYPAVFDLGLANLRELLGVEVVEYPTTRMPAEELHQNPQKRAEDVNAAFADPSIKAIFSSIGGDDSVRILPYLDSGTIVANPKILMGFSDTTTLLTYANQVGMVTFNGPSIMAGFAQIKTLPPSFGPHIRQMLMEPCDQYTYVPYGERVTEFEDWGTPGYSGQITAVPNAGWRWLQGETVVHGRLFGGNIEVLEFLKSTRWWPEAGFWHGKILFLETSEEKPTPSQVKYMLRNYGMQGVFEQITGLLFARPQYYSDDERAELHKVIVSVVAAEFGHPELPIVAEMDFGHEAPQSIMPLGIQAEINCVNRTVSLLESVVS